MTHELHAFGWDMLINKGDEIESRQGDITTQASRRFLIPKAHLLSLVVGKMRHGQWRMTHVTANIRGSGHTFGIETVGVDLQASSFTIERINDTL
ncbi:MAG: hypothetical protein WA996_17140 [Candidatus Promineifilaceae bacterium]